MEGRQVEVVAKLMMLPRVSNTVVCPMYDWHRDNGGRTLKDNNYETAQECLRTTVTKPLRSAWRQPLQKLLRNAWRQLLGDCSGTLGDNRCKTAQEHYKLLRNTWKRLLQTTREYWKTAFAILLRDAWRQLLQKPLTNAWKQLLQAAQEHLKTTATNRSGMLEDNH